MTSAPPAGGARRTRRRAPLTGAAMAVLSLAGVTLMVLSALGIGRISLRSAEHDRLDERARLLQQIFRYATSYGPADVQSSVIQTPFDRDDPAINKRLIGQFGTTPAGDPVALAALIAPGGTVLASTHPRLAPPGRKDLGTAWDVAARGDASWSQAFQFDGQTAWASVAPVGGSAPWATLVVVQQSRTQAAQTFVAQLGALGIGHSGGLSLSDRFGTAMFSWDPARLGTRGEDPGYLARLPQQRVVQRVSGDGSSQVTALYYSASGVTAAFQQPTSQLFGDLRAQQRQRDLTLLAVLGAASLSVIAGSLVRLRAVHRNQARLHALLSNSQDLILVFGRDERVLYASPAVGTLLGRDDDLTGLPLHTLAHPDDLTRLSELIRDPAGSGALLDVRLGSVSGSHRWYDVEASDLAVDPQLRGVLFTCHDAGERKTLQDELISQAQRDSLTGLPNRLTLVRSLSEALAGSQSDDGTTGPALLFVDLDRFKQVNDRYGHECGDQVLRTFSDRLRYLIGDGDLACRFGGDEFGIILQDAGEARARRIAEAVVAAASQPFEILPAPDGSPDTSGDGTGGVPVLPTWVEVGASVGISLGGARLSDPESLLRAADAAMYEAKTRGRGRIALAGQPDGSVLAVAPQMAGGAVPVPGASPIDTGTFRPAGTSGRDDPALDPLPVLARTRPAAAIRAPSRAGAVLGSWLHHVRSVAVLLVASLAIVAVAGVGLWQSTHARATAEHRRLAERLTLTGRVGGYASGVVNLKRLIPPVNAAPWALDGSLVDSLVISGVLASGIGGEGSSAALVRNDGTVLARSGASLPPGISVGDRAWQQAIAGEVGHKSLFEFGGEPFSTVAVPIFDPGGQGEVAAVLVVAQSLRNSVSEEMLKVLGSLGFGAGGVSSVDLDGVATHSWNPALIGQRLVPAGQLAGLSQTHASVVAGPAGMVTLAVRVKATQDNYRKVIIFQQPVGVFYGDLRSGQPIRDLALLAVVIVAIALLGMLRWQREKVMRDSARRLDALLRSSHDIVIVTQDPAAQDPATQNAATRDTASTDDAGGTGAVSFISSAITGLLGHDPGDWLGEPIDGLVHPHDRSRTWRYLATPRGTLHNIRLQQAGGGFRWFDLRAVDLREEPAVMGVVISCHEVGERKALQDELSFRARHDGLTGLPNRSLFTQHLDLLAYGLEPGSASSGTSGSYTVLFIDLDRFKPVNDTFGHDAGDAVLRSVARRLGEVSGDHPGATVCRLGGDEFAVLLPGVNPGAAARMANAILERVRQPIVIPGRTSQAVTIGATIGIAYSQETASPSMIVRYADEAMYRAKESGRGRYAVHQDSAP